MPAAALLAGWIASVLATAAFADSRSVLRIGYQDNAFSAVLFLAEARGLLAERELEAELVPYPSGKLALAALNAGEVRAATVAGIPLAIDSFDDPDWAIVATIASTRRGAWIIARKDLGVNEPRDLRGTAIGTQRGSAVHYFLDRFLARQGIPQEEVEIRFLPAVALPGALVRGEIQAFSMRNPFVAEAKDVLGDSAVEFFDPEAYRQTFNLVVERRIVENRPQEVRGLVSALVDSAELIQRQPDRALERLVTRLGEERRHELAQDWKRNIYDVALEQGLLLSLEDKARWAMDKDMVPRQEIPNYLDLVHLDALKSVDPDRVTVIH